MEVKNIIRAPSTSPICPKLSFSKYTELNRKERFFVSSLDSIKPKILINLINILFLLVVNNGLRVFSEKKSTSKEKSTPKENLEPPICDSQPKIITKKPLQEKQRSSSFTRINFSISPNNSKSKKYEETKKIADYISSIVISEEKNRKIISMPHSNKSSEEKANSVLPNICNSLFLADKLKNGNGVFMGVSHKSLLNKAKSEPKFALAIIREEKKKQIEIKEEIRKGKRKILFSNECKTTDVRKKIPMLPLHVYSLERK